MHPARQRYHDPRMGDEGPADEHRPHAQQEHPHTEKHVRLEAPSDGVGPNSAPASGEKKAPEQQQPRPSRLRKLGSLLVHKFPINLQWVPNNWTWSKIKPVIRSAAMGWVSVLFMIIPRTERMLGQVSIRYTLYAPVPATSPTPCVCMRCFDLHSCRRRETSFMSFSLAFSRRRPNFLSYRTFDCLYSIHRLTSLFPGKLSHPHRLVRLQVFHCVTLY